MPKIVVDDFGGKRSDPGMLGSGIYFSSSARYGLKDSYTACIVRLYCYSFINDSFKLKSDTEAGLFSSDITCKQAFINDTNQSYQILIIRY